MTINVLMRNATKRTSMCVLVRIKTQQIIHKLVISYINCNRMSLSLSRSAPLRKMSHSVDSVRSDVLLCVYSIWLGSVWFGFLFWSSFLVLRFVLVIFVFIIYLEFQNWNVCVQIRNIVCVYFYCWLGTVDALPLKKKKRKEKIVKNCTE